MGALWRQQSKAAEDKHLPKDHLLLPFLLEGVQTSPRRVSKREGPGKKGEPYGRDGWNVLAGRFCDSWPAAIDLGRKAKGRGSWGVRARGRQEWHPWICSKGGWWLYVCNGMPSGGSKNIRGSPLLAFLED